MSHQTTLPARHAPPYARPTYKYNNARPAGHQIIPYHQSTSNQISWQLLLESIITSMSSSSSTDDVEADEIMYCASCGKAGVDDVKLKRCISCYLVRYCGTDCQKAHWRQHKEACKKRAAELREERLFQQPQHGDLGDCPICLLPLSNDFEKSTMQSCCYKLICNGCAYASLLHGEDGSLEDVCAFCRQPYPESEEEIWKNVMSRIEANDPVAMRQMGVKCHSEGDF